MPLSYLTTPPETIKAGAAGLLEEMGYDYDPYRETFAEFLAEVLTDLQGSVASNRRMSENQLVAAVVNEISGGSYSNLRDSPAELLGALYEAAEGWYVLPTPVLLESFDTAAQWAAAGGATLSNDTVRKVQGTGSLVIAADGTQAPQATKTAVASVDKADMGVIAWCQDHGDDPEYQTATSIDMRLGVGGTYRGSSGVTNPTVSDINLGKLWQSYNINDLSGHPSGVSQIDVRVQGANGAPRCDSVRVDALYRNAAGRPTVLLTFDNAYIGAYTNAFPKLASLGLKASMFVAGTSADIVGAPDHLTLAQVQELYEAGWDICPNGTSTDNSMTDLASVAAAVSEINGVASFLSANGMTRGLDCFCYPNGSSRVSGTKVQVASVTSTGTEVVTMASTTGIVAGYKAAGVLVPQSPATTVVSVDNGTTLTLSSPIPAGTSAMSFTNTSGAFHTGKLQAGLKSAGYKFGRLTANGQRFTRFGLGDQGLLFPAYNLGPTAFPDLTAFNTRVNTVVSRGHTICFYTHNVVTGGSGLHMTPENFNAFADELASRVADNQLDVLTLSEFMARDGNASPP